MSFSIASLRVAVLGLGLTVAGYAGDVDQAAVNVPVTYAKQVSRLVQTNCESCHRPGQIAPFSLTNYRQVKAWSKMIKEVVQNKRMPPWHADPGVGHAFGNDRSLTPEEIDTLVSWIDHGMPLGDEADLPDKIEYVSDWRIGQPDMVFEMPEEYVVEPVGVVAYQYFTTETNFTEDKWITMSECRPGNAKVVHHIIIFVRDPKNSRESLATSEGGQGFFDAYAPGSEAMVLKPGSARKIPAGASLIWQMHYTPTGKREADRSQFAIKFADGPINTQVTTTEAINTGFEIPAHASNHRVEAELTFSKGATIFSLSPHMHYRGKAFDYVLVYPDGREDKLLQISRYDFGWQTTYELAEPVHVPAGAKMKCVAHFDNSEDNPYNPQPGKAVRWGDQTWEEMMIGFFHLSWDKDAQQAKAQPVAEGTL